MQKEARVDLGFLISDLGFLVAAWLRRKIRSPKSEIPDRVPH